MVEELAFLVKDNLPCKHLILSMEEDFVNFLQDDTSSDGVMELEPMNSYNRLLLHRLADIFGFAHESVGEGDDRHIILERCPETSIPPILVSDILWQYDASPSPAMSHQLLRRKEDSPESEKKLLPFQYSFEERETAYMAARERIFSMDEGESKEPIQQKPRSVPVVAQRMIAHALGKRINSCSQGSTNKNARECKGQTGEPDSREKNKIDPTLIYASSVTERKASEKPANENSIEACMPQNGRSGSGVNRDNMKDELSGAAKRIFAHALGRNLAKDGLSSKCSETKQINIAAEQIDE
ncbi:uncharacterized protein LOC131154221 isoform X2 [Malania oleifera]|nr:uncharacterized protein LOC131154221 isoform X2 [Malania oleifera]